MCLEEKLADALYTKMDGRLTASDEIRQASSQ